MPIASGGGSGSQKPSGSSAAAGANAVEFVISAKNEADRPLTLVTASLDKVRGGAESVSKSFEDMGKTASEAMESVLKAIDEVAKKALPLLINTSNASGVALQKLWGIATSAAAGFNSLFEAVSNVYSILSSQPVTSFFDGLSQAAVKLISDTGRLSDTIKGLSSVSVGLGSGFTGVNIKPITTQFDGLLTKIDNIDAGFSKFVKNVRNSTNAVNTALGGLTTGIGFFSGIDEPLKMFEFLKGSVETAASAISGVSANIFFVISAIDQLKGVVLGGPFELLIGQNIKLQEQMLATQATLAATAQIVRDGIAIGDPGQAILEFAAPIRQTLSDIRKDSLELVGVTSNELIDVFQLVTQSLTDVKLSIGEAGKLSIAFAASLGTIGVPLYQARQEIQSILTGQIDQNSVLAKSIGLTNAQLKNWIAQDKVYERLNERLSAFVAGNQLASKTIGGLTSNIKEIFDEIGRRAGADFLPPIQDGVDEIYQFLLSNQDEMAKVVQNFLRKLSTAFSEVVKAMKPLLDALTPLGQGIAKFISEAAIGVLKGFAEGIKTATAALAPFLDILGKLSQVVASNPLIPLFVQLKVLQTSFGIATQFAGTFINTIPLVGEALFALKVRSLPVINAFGNLSSAFAGNVSALVNFGAAIVNTPAGLGILEKSVGNVTRGLSNFLTTNQAISKIPLLSGLAGNTAVLGMFSGLLVSSTPALLGFAKNALAIGDAFGLSRDELKKFASDTLRFVANAAETANIPDFFGFGTKIRNLRDKVAPQLKDIAENSSDTIGIIESKLIQLGETTGKTVQSMIIRYGLWGAAIFSVATGISLMISKNEDLGKVVKWIADLVQSAVTPVLQFFGSTLGQITLVATGLGIAIATGLLPKFLGLVNSFKELIAANMPTTLKAIFERITILNASIRDGSNANKDYLVSLRSIYDPQAIEIGIREFGKKIENAIDPQAMQSRLLELRKNISEFLSGISIGNPLSGLSGAGSGIGSFVDDLKGRFTQIAGTAKQAGVDILGNLVPQGVQTRLLELRKNIASAIDPQSLQINLLELKKGIANTFNPDLLQIRLLELRKNIAEAFDLQSLQIRLLEMRKSGSVMFADIASSAKDAAQNARDLGANLASALNPQSLKAKAKQIGASIAEALDPEILAKNARMAIANIFDANAGKIAQGVTAVTTANSGLIEGTVSLFQKTTVAASTAAKTIAVNVVGAFQLLGATIAAAGEALAAFVVAYAPIIAVAAAIGVVVATITRLLALEARRTEAVREYNKEMRETLELTRQLRKEKEGEVESDQLLKPETAEEREAFTIGGEGGVRRIRYERGQQKGFEKINSDLIDSLYEPDATDRLVTGLIARITGENPSNNDTLSTRLTQNLAQDIKGQDLRVAEGRKTFADIFGSLSDIRNDGEGLNSKIVGEIRETQNLQQRIAQLNKEGNTSLAKVLQGQAEFRNKTLDKQLESARAEIEYQRSLDYLSGKQAADRDRYVAELERAIAVAEGVRSGEILPAKPVENGTLLAQTQIDYRAFSNQLEAGGGRILGLPDQIERYNNQLISSVQSLLQGNQLDTGTAEDAINKLQIVASSTTGDPRTVKQAEETILAVRKDITDRLLQEEERRQKGIELLRQKGQVSYLKSLDEELKAIIANEEIRRSEAKRTEIILRQNIENQRQAQNSLFDKQIAEQQASTEAALAELQRNNPGDTQTADDIRESGRQAVLALNQEKKEANDAYNTQILERNRLFAIQETEARLAYFKQSQEQQIRIVKETQDRITQQITYSESARNEQVQKLYNDRLIFEEDVSLLRADSTQRTIDREIEAEKAALEEYKKYGAAYEKEARQSEIKIQELLIKRLENEDNAWKAQLEVLKRNLKLQVDAFKNAKEEENKEILIQQKYLEALSNTNQKRVELLSTAKDALSSATGGITGLFESLGTLTPNEGVRRNFDEAANGLRVNLLVDQFELEKKMYDIQQQQNKIALKRQIIEAELLSIQTQQLVIQKSGELKQAQLALAQNPGDRQAQIDVDTLSRELNAYVAQLGVVSEQKQVATQELQITESTQGIRDTNFVVEYFNNLSQEINKSVALLPRSLQQGALQSYRGMLEKFLEENTNINIDFTQYDDLRKLGQLLAQLSRSMSGELTGNTGAFSIPTLPVATIRAQQQELNQQILGNNGFELRGLTRVNSSEFADPFLQDLVENSREQINTMFPNLQQALTESGRAIDMIGDITNKADKSVQELLATSEALIAEQMPDLQEQLDVTANTQIPTANSVLSELGDRLDTLSMEVIPDVQESIDIISYGATSAIDGIVSAVETRLPSIEEQVSALLDEILTDISNAQANLPGASGTSNTAQNDTYTPTEQQTEQALRYRIDAFDLLARNQQNRVEGNSGAAKAAYDLYYFDPTDNNRRDAIKRIRQELNSIRREIRESDNAETTRSLRAQEREALQRMYDINPTNRTARDLERLNRFAPTSTPTDRNRATLSSSAGAGAASNNNQFQQQLAINVTTGDIVGGNEKAGQTIAEIAYRTFSNVVETGSALRRVGLQSLNA